MGYNYKVCEDEDDAARMAETILITLGYANVARPERSERARRAIHHISTDNRPKRRAHRALGKEVT